MEKKKWVKILPENVQRNEQMNNDESIPSKIIL
jgi:hypothetical protein